MGRPRVYDADHIAKDIYETFTAREVKKRTRFDFDWPEVWQHVGDSLAIAYASDKWRDDGEQVLYKHLAESRNRAYCVPGFLRDWDNPREKLPVIGPMVSFEDMIMPKQFAVMALFEELNLQLHTRGRDDRPRFGRGDEGIVKVVLAHGMLGGGKYRTKHGDEVPFLIVYTAKDGPCVFVTGDELDILADGIVG